jgi:hypothetical protein
VLLVFGLLAGCSDLPVTAANIQQRQVPAAALVSHSQGEIRQQAKSIEIQGTLSSSLEISESQEREIEPGRHGLFLHLRSPSLDGSESVRFVWRHRASGKTHEERGVLFGGESIGGVAHLPRQMAFPGEWTIEVFAHLDHASDEVLAFRHEFKIVSDANAR